MHSDIGADPPSRIGEGTAGIRLTAVGYLNARLIVVRRETLKPVTCERSNIWQADRRRIHAPTHGPSL